MASFKIWLKREEMSESIVDAPSAQLSDIFDHQTGKIQKQVKDTIAWGVSQITQKFPDLRVLDYFVVGAAVTHQYGDTSDIDTTVVLDPNTSDQLMATADKWIEQNLDNQHMWLEKRPFQWKVSKAGREHLENVDAAYDPRSDQWIKQTEVSDAMRMHTTKVAVPFSRENRLYRMAEPILQRSLGDLYRAISSDRNAEQMKQVIVSAFRWYKEWIKRLRMKAYSSDPEPGFTSQNWGTGNIIYKMLDREGYTHVYDIMKDIIRVNGFWDAEHLAELKDALALVIEDEPGYFPRFTHTAGQ